MTPLVSPGEPSLTTIPIGALGALPQVLAGLGTEPWALLRPFGIGPRSFDEPLMALPAATHGAILQAAVEASGCDHIGLLLGRNATLGNTGPLRFVMLNAPTVRAAIEALMAFGPIWYPAIALTMHQEAEYARFSVAIRRACAGDDQILTGYLAANVRILQIVLGQTWHPVSVRVAHRTPASVAPFRSFFGCPVYFDQGVNEVWFPRELLGQTRRALTADVELDTFLRTQLAELRSKDDFVGQVRETIRSLLPRGECTAERAAALFHLHRQTLHRHLARRGTTFEQLVEQVRRELAEQLLTSTELSVAEASGLLGYGSQSSFTRAFRRWFGATPQRWRIDARERAAANAAGDASGEAPGSSESAQAETAP